MTTIQQDKMQRMQTKDSKILLFLVKCYKNKTDMIRYNLFFFYPEEWKTRKFNDILFRHSNAVYNQNTIDRWTKGYILPFPKKGDLRIAKKC